MLSETKSGMAARYMMSNFWDIIKENNVYSNKDFYNKAVAAFSGRNNKIVEVGEVEAELVAIWLNKGHSHFVDLIGCLTTNGKQLSYETTMPNVLSAMIGKLYIVTA